MALLRPHELMKVGGRTWSYKCRACPTPNHHQAHPFLRLAGLRSGTQGTGAGIHTPTPRSPHRGYRVSPVRRGFCVNGPYYRLTGDTRRLWWGERWGSAHTWKRLLPTGPPPRPTVGTGCPRYPRGFCVNGPYYRLTGDTRRLWRGGDGGARTRGNGCCQRVQTRTPPWVPGVPGTTRCVASRCGAGRELHLSGRARVDTVDVNHPQPPGAHFRPTCQTPIVSPHPLFRLPALRCGAQGREQGALFHQHPPSDRHTPL